MGKESSFQDYGQGSEEVSVLLGLLLQEGSPPMGWLEESGSVWTGGEG